MKRISIHLLAGVFIAAGGVVVLGQGPVTITDGQNREKVKGYQRETRTLGRGYERQLRGPAAGAPADLAITYLREQRATLGLTSGDLADVALNSALTSTNTGVTHVYFQQQHAGIPVNTAVANVNVMRDGSIMSAGSSFVENLAGTIVGLAPSMSAAEAAAAAAAEIGRTPTEPFEVIEARGGTRQETLLTAGGVAEGQIRASLVYQPVGPRETRLGWLVEIMTPDGAGWQTVVDAASGEALYTYDMVDRDHWPLPFATDAPGEIVVSRTPAAFSSTAVSSAAIGPPVAADENPVASYNVFAIPKESPTDGGRTLEVGPADGLASPWGWHDTNGAVGPEFLVTRGNNAHAYTDVDANNIPDPGSDPSGGPGLVFDFPLDLGQNPPSYRPAAVVNLFYWNNLMHDVSYRYGFTEEAGNFQVNNYGRTTFVGGDNDDVRAEAQDGSGTNNANFLTLADGQRPRMQMFVWTSPTPNEVFVPAGPAAGTYVASAATFGPTFAATGPRTGLLVVGLDPADPDGPSTTDGCSPLTNAAEVAGNIALVDRGTCPFSQKVFNAQNAGAIAVIVGNNVPGAPITMGFTAPIPVITIPSGMVSLDHANLFKAHAPFGATARTGAGSINRDSDLDAGVIAHEYGHGISNRLTGGRNIVTCLGNQEQMGEGWSDWYALVMTAKAGDTGPQRRGIGTYVIYQPADGNGIRPTPYSTDMSINPSTYDTIKLPTITVPHGVGYVWNTMLWDMYWALVDVYGFNENIYDPWHSGGNNLAVQLVQDGMKFQPCQPGFVTGRNGILQADVALASGANQCTIWRAFARRGLGFSANQGLSTSRLDGTEAFDLPLACQVEPLPPITNRQTVRAGSTVPVRFSLGGNFGTDIFAAGFPRSLETVCATGAPLGPESPTIGTGPTYDARSNTYQYDWKTEKSWSGTCRAFKMQLSDGSLKTIFFQFR